MAREKKKRMMPRHLLTAAVLTGMIPGEMVTADEGKIALEELKRLEVLMTPKRPQPRAKSEEAKQMKQSRAVATAGNRG